MGTDCKSAAFQLRWFESTRAHQELQYPNRVLEFLFLYKLLSGHSRVDENSCGAVAKDSTKTARWAVFSSAACESTAFGWQPPERDNLQTLFSLQHRKTHVHQAKNPNLFPIGERFGFFRLYKAHCYCCSACHRASDGSNTAMLQPARRLCTDTSVLPSAVVA